jgi:hypothetical protein
VKNLARQETYLLIVIILFNRHNGLQSELPPANLLNCLRAGLYGIFAIGVLFVPFLGLIFPLRRSRR